MSKKTPLYDEHLKLNARMVDFAGWIMPIQYRGLKEEHLCVRQNVGLFDVSHMGEIRVRGPQALSTLQWLTTNNVAKLQAGEAQYSLLPNEQGGLVDDIIVYCLTPNDDYLVCVNASNTEKDFQWMIKNNKGAQITNESEQWGQIAIQGPKALELCDLVFGFEVSKMGSFTIASKKWKQWTIMVARTGYTGESGCEVFIESQGTAQLWQELLEKGKKYSVEAIGLGARDTLRTEMKYSLYGHEIDDSTNPFAAALGWVVKPKDKEFLGQAKIIQQKEAGLPQKLIGLKMIDKGIPRQGYLLFSFDNKEIGKVTSGTHSPTLDEPIAIAYLNSAYCQEGSEVFVDIRGRKAKAVVCKTPFVSR